MDSMVDIRCFPSGKKVYLLDTSAVKHDPEIAERLSADGNVVVLSIYVLQELNKSKKFQDEVGMNSRIVSRLLDKYREDGCLSEGVKTKSGGTIVVDCDGHEKYFEKYLPGLERTVDNRIIATALLWKNESKGKYEKVAIVSKDMVLRVTANAFGVDTEDYETDKSVEHIEDLYTGVATIQLPDEDANLLLVNFPRDKKIAIPALSEGSQIILNGLFANQCLEIGVAGKKILAVYKKHKGELKWVKLLKDLPRGKNVMPINTEQAFEYELMCDDDISLVAVSGGAGTGKTLISMLAGFDQVEQGKYETVIVYRPNVEIGNSLGFLPGPAEEKFSPWMQPILDNLSLIIESNDHDENCGKKEVSKREAEEVTCDYMMGPKGYLRIHPINYVRGRSLHKSFIIIDEAQNLTPHQVKTIITRAGKNTKIVLTGDCSQIDIPYLDSVSNGLAFMIERFKDQKTFGTIKLVKGERSPLSELAAQLL